MLRKTTFLECDDGDELAEAMRYARARDDGGRTYIKLCDLYTYCLAEPLNFDVNSRVTVDFDGMEIVRAGNGCVIRRPAEAHDAARSAS